LKIGYWIFFNKGALQNVNISESPFNSPFGNQKSFSWQILHPRGTSPEQSLANIGV
jgi:hypothetical protein